MKKSFLKCCKRLTFSQYVGTGIHRKDKKRFTVADGEFFANKINKSEHLYYDNSDHMCLINEKRSGNMEWRIHKYGSDAGYVYVITVHSLGISSGRCVDEDVYYVYRRCV